LQYLKRLLATCIFHEFTCHLPAALPEWIGVFNAIHHRYMTLTTLAFFRSHLKKQL
jgi:hypothetical protein